MKLTFVTLALCISFLACDSSNKTNELDAAATVTSSSPVTVSSTVNSSDKDKADETVKTAQESKPASSASMSVLPMTSVDAGVSTTTK